MAESDACLVVTETDHVDRLYVPESGVRWELFAPSDRSTECPFKGRASYSDPLPEVAGIAGHVSFYDNHFRMCGATGRGSVRTANQD